MRRKIMTRLEKRQAIEAISEKKNHTLQCGPYQTIDLRTSGFLPGLVEAAQELDVFVLGFMNKRKPKEITLIGNDLCLSIFQFGWAEKYGIQKIEEMLLSMDASGYPCSEESFIFRIKLDRPQRLHLKVSLGGLINEEIKLSLSGG